jgi:hypothetical protein
VAHPCLVRNPATPVLITIRGSAKRNPNFPFKMLDET